MKVLHLPIGGQMTVVCPALRGIGVEATSVHFRQGKLHFVPDLCLNLEKRSEEVAAQMSKQFFEEAVKRYDVFHFHFGQTFFPDGSDLPYLKKKGKKLVIQHRGSDVRRLSVALKMKNPFVRIKKGRRMKEEYIRERLTMLSRYIDHAIVADYELYPYISGYYKHIHVIPNAVELSRFKPKYPSRMNKRPLIVHAPTNTNVKGTEFVLAAIKKLKEKGYRFDFRLVQKLKHADALKLYRSADIVIDQLNIGTYGVLSLEAMAYGKPVICYVNKNLLDKYPSKLPIINGNPENVYRRIRRLIKDPVMRHDIGKQSRSYVAQNHDAAHIARRLSDLYASL
jgi:glycosyltransferase involved in cell wall biosynthesis